ncbi:hypothetical protein IJ541_00645 [bacterium]|nr:hypothetical protein [bacterium]
MKVDCVNNNNLYYSNPKREPSFGAVHPVRYFVKSETDGGFHQVTELEILKTLQRKIVTWLNKDYNDAQRRKKGLSVRIPKVDKDKPIRERIVRFFKNRVPDYLKRNQVHAFRKTNSLGEIESYLLSGKTVDMAADCAKPICFARHSAKERFDLIADSFGIDLKKAQEAIMADRDRDLKFAKAQYIEDLYSRIKQCLLSTDINNSHFDAYFVPLSKGGKTKYELVDAKFNGR